MRFSTRARIEAGDWVVPTRGRFKGQAGRVHRTVPADPRRAKPWMPATLVVQFGERAFGRYEEHHVKRRNSP